MTTNRPEPVEAVIFDLDATLVDSEPNYYLADRELLGRRGVAFTEEDKRRYIGGGNLDMMVDLKARFGLAESPEALAAEKNGIYLALAERHTAAYPEMQRLWDALRERRVPVAVASGSGPDVIRRVLAAAGIGFAGAPLVSAEEVPRGKPAPDVFLEAARRLGVAPARCVVIEDSRFGVEAARRAGMRCIAVPYLVEPPLDAAFRGADLLFEAGMPAFRAERALVWIAGLR